MTFSFISDETLLGYLLGALDEHEQAVVQNTLLHDRHLRARLTALQSMSVPMPDIDDIYEPPGAMVSRVMSNVVRNVDGDLPEPESSLMESPSAADESSMTQSSANFRRGSFMNGWLDTGMSLTAAAIGFCLIAPAILQSRESARASQCESGLMTLGQQIREFAFHNRHASLPVVPTEGPLAFAGVYAIRLNDTGHLEESKVLWCPSERENRLVVVGLGEHRLPSAIELRGLSGARRRVWQHIAGGSYAYNLGVFVNNQHTMPTLKDHSDVAILADAPLRSGGSKLLFTAHRGLASNVLYRDGRVQLMKLDDRYDGPDHPYLNRNGVTEAGIDRNDSALGASYLPPLGSSR